MHEHENENETENENENENWRGMSVMNAEVQRVSEAW